MPFRKRAMRHQLLQYYRLVSELFDTMEDRQLKSMGIEGNITITTSCLFGLHCNGNSRLCSCPPTFPTSLNPAVFKEMWKDHQFYRCKKGRRYRLLSQNLKSHLPLIPDLVALIRSYIVIINTARVDSQFNVHIN